MGGVWPIFLSIFRPTQCQAVANSIYNRSGRIGIRDHQCFRPYRGVLHVEAQRPCSALGWICRQS